MSNEALSAWTNSTLRNQYEGTEEATTARAGGKSGASGGGFLMTLAKVLGELIDKMADNLQKFSESLGESPTAAQTTELTAKSQMFSLFMNNASTVIKTIGEANAGMARKQ